jgi:hypothetical protein
VNLAQPTVLLFDKELLYTRSRLVLAIDERMFDIGFGSGSSLRLEAFFGSVRG